jgi:hypothetical protein
MANPNRPWPECCATGVESYDADRFLGDPHNFHSNPGFMGTSTATMGQMASPGSIYRTPGSQNVLRGDKGHQAMPYGGRRPQKSPGKQVTPAPRDFEPVSEGSPLVVQTGSAQY